MEWDFSSVDQSILNVITNRRKSRVENWIHVPIHNSTQLPNIRPRTKLRTQRRGAIIPIIPARRKLLLAYANVLAALGKPSRLIIGADIYLQAHTSQVSQQYAIAHCSSHMKTLLATQHHRELLGHCGQHGEYSLRGQNLRSVGECCVSQFIVSY